MALWFVVSWLMSAARAGTITLAVAPFAAHTDNDQLRAVGTGLQTMLVTDLAKVEQLTLVEREALQAILTEQKLARSDLIDAKTAVRAGKAVGAHYLLTGAVIALRPNMRLDARLVDVQAGTVRFATEVEGPSEEFFLLEKQLALQVIEKLEVQATALETARLARAETEDLEAFLSWSKALEALDAGQVDAAARELDAALARDDGFSAAKQIADTIKDQLVDLEQTRSRVASDRLDSVSARIAEAARNEDWGLLQQVVAPMVQQSQQLSLAERRALAKQLLDIPHPEDLTVAGMPTLHVREWAMADLVMASYADGHTGDVLEWGKVLVERYPMSMYARGMGGYLQMVSMALEKRAEGEARLSTLDAEATWTAMRPFCEWGPRTRQGALDCLAIFEAAHTSGIDTKLHLGRLRTHLRESFDREAVEKARTWATDNGVELDLESIFDSLDSYASAIVEEDGSPVDWKSRIADASQPGPARYLAARARRGGDIDTAYEILDAGIKKFPDRDDLFEQGWEIASERWERDRVVDYMKRAQKAGHDVSSGERLLERLDKRIALRASLPGDVLYRRAGAYREAGLHRRAHDVWLELAERFPEHRHCDQPCALLRAAGDIDRSLVPGKRAMQRTLLQRVVLDHPDSTEFTSATVQLQHLSK